MHVTAFTSWLATIACKSTSSCSPCRSNPCFKTHHNVEHASEGCCHRCRAALAQLDVKFRALHLYGRHVLDGTQVAVAYLDLAAATLHLASSGGCRVVVTTRDALGRSEVRTSVNGDGFVSQAYVEQCVANWMSCLVAGAPVTDVVSPNVSQVAVELGRPSPEDTAAAQDAAEAAATHRLRGQRQQRREQQRQQAPKKGAAQQSSGSRLGDNMLSMPLHGDVESIVLGSTGLWCVFMMHLTKPVGRHKSTTCSVTALCSLTIYCGHALNRV